MGPAGAVVTGSHLDSVPDGGAFDGPLGVVTAFAAIDLLRERGKAPVRPLAVAAFCEEEGARFGVACLGSRLLAGAIEPARARALTDSGGTTFAEAMTAAGHDPGALGPDQALVAGIGAYVELHIEQGRALADLDAAIGVAERIWPHGRWRLTFTGRADHAGTTRLSDRRDPMLAAAAHDPGRARGRRQARGPGHGRQADRGPGRGQRDQFVGDRLAGRQGAGRGQAARGRG